MRIDELLRLHRFGDERGLGTEEAEECDFVDARGFRDASRRRATKARARVNTRSGFDDALAIQHDGTATNWIKGREF